MLTTIFAVIAAVIVVILLVAAAKPDAFRVERTTTIAARAEVIFPLIDDFRRCSTSLRRR